jgi:hypothetical protein
MNEQLRRELLQMQEEDYTTRRKLVEAGQLYGPHLPEGFYHPEMATIHNRNNARLREIIDEYGWPGRSLVGQEACEAAWLIAQHALSDPDLRDRCLPLLESAVNIGEAPAWQFAMLTDSILMHKDEPQLYGCIFVGGEAGKLVPWKIADPEHVDARRAAVGLPSLAEKMAELQARVNLEEQVQRAANEGKA